MQRRMATIVARAKLPLDDLPPSQMVAFRDPAAARNMSRWWSEHSAASRRWSVSTANA